MSADGEIDIAVRAEGTDEAAAELADADGGGGSGGGDGEGGLSQALSGGIIGGLVSQLLGPLMDVLNPILDVLKAFLAPVALLLLRAFAPVLRELLQLLPGWFEFIDSAPGLLGDMVQFIRDLPRLITTFLRDPLGTLQQGFQSAIEWLSNQFSLGDLIGLSRDVLTRLSEVLVDLSNTVADAIADGLRRFFDPGGNTDVPGVSVERDPDTGQVTWTEGPGGVPLESLVTGPIPITIDGSLAPFAELAERSQNIDFVP